ncbi:DUF4864 domain-containing protein [Pseudoroseicyclus tamaricis]|uniref:DUF4864 domain-containing protein n=1 Tax=Pseudoroseicyclus tamaricis TaxID=2705421 RepID=A0A6B2JLN0_9RHOB|nr:DUF4864 domain-containing protein [Pseudoroseicyclus tamaricis]NDU99526.1 DUF4864 domain-containing protein [Pseudoroseicyclus tamaricis]
MPRRFIAALALVVAVALAGFGATPAAAEAEDEIEEVITSQLDAFNSRDVEAAWLFASPGIQAIFGGPERFGQMVEEGYPMVWTSEGARMAGQPDLGPGLWQEVWITDAAGALHALGYKMVQIDGDWRIDAVVLLPPPDLGV